MKVASTDHGTWEITTECGHWVAQHSDRERSYGGGESGPEWDAPECVTATTLEGLYVEMEDADQRAIERRQAAVREELYDGLFSFDAVKRMAGYR